MNLFYAPEISEGLFTIDKEESAHLVRVLRIKANDLVHFTDGKGFFYECKIVDANPKKCTVLVEKKYEGKGKRNFFLQIGIAPTKNISRFEWFLEKSTEIGIDTITPLICAHSERKEVKIGRLDKVITAAVKQSIKAYHPKLEEKQTFNSFIEQPFNGQKFIGYVEKEISLSLAKAYLPGSNAIVLIGPEGDFSPEEIELAKNNGFIPINLGQSRLRTETAGVVACHTINLLNA